MKSTRFSTADISQMDNLVRVAFFNSLSGFKSASLIGSIDGEGQTNLAIFSSVIHLGSNPALFGFINRPDTVSRHTLDNILETNSFTINHIHLDIYRQAHQTSARYPKDLSEFDAVGLTPQFRGLIKAPYVAESKIKYGLEFAERIDLKINGTILIIGRVVEVILPENSLHRDGAIDIERAGTVAISGLDSYHSTSLLSRLSYAKPDQPLEALINEK